MTAVFLQLYIYVYEDLRLCKDGKRWTFIIACVRTFFSCPQNLSSGWTATEQHKLLRKCILTNHSINQIKVITGFIYFFYKKKKLYNRVPCNMRLYEIQPFFYYFFN